MLNIFENFSEKDITYSLYGLFLGDGSYKYGWIRNQHTNKQRFYCEWLETIFLKFGLKTATSYDYMMHTNLGDAMYSSVRVKVPKKFYFETQNKCFDDNNKKIVSDYVLSNINSFGLLLWFLDDGQLHVSFKDNRAKRFAMLNTQSFSLEENQKIAKMFKDRFDIDLRIHKDSSGFEKYKDKVYYRLYFNATNFRKFYDIVREYLPYIPKEFEYKFNMQYFKNRIKKSEEYAEKYNFKF